jgi:hypothetical protein
MKPKQTFHLPEPRMNEEAPGEEGGATSQHPKKRGAESVSCVRLHSLPDLRLRLSKPDKVVQVRGKPHIYRTSLIPRPAYCQSQSIQPTTWYFHLSTLASAIHLLVARLHSQKQCHCPCHTGYWLSAENPKSPVGGEWDSNWRLIYQRPFYFYCF